MGDASGGTAAYALPGNITQQIDTFLTKYPMDQRAYDFLVDSAPEVQLKVLAEFRPKSEGDSDYSACITTFVRRLRVMMEGGGGMSGLVHDPSLQAFRSK